MDDKRDALVDSWIKNADQWTQAVREKKIASRVLVTDEAIVGAALASKPEKILDVGCGEGWLCRALADKGREIIGVDASPELIASATAAGAGRFVCCSYDGLIENPQQVGRGFDLIIANFSLLDDRAGALLSALATTGVETCRLLIQTLHPASVERPDEDGWRTEDFRSFKDSNWQPMPWYHRTLDSWVAALEPAWKLASVEEPVNPQTGRPASLILHATLS